MDSSPDQNDTKFQTISTSIRQTLLYWRHLTSILQRINFTMNTQLSHQGLVPGIQKKEILPQ